MWEEDVGQEVLPKWEGKADEDISQLAYVLWITI